MSERQPQPTALVLLTHSRTRVRLALFLAAAAFFVFSVLQASRVHAISVQWVINGPIWDGAPGYVTLYEYDWHFDEDDYPSYGALDFSPPTCMGTLCYGPWLSPTNQVPGAIGLRCARMDAPAMELLSSTTPG